jgi:excisionase family DNA binding protein
MPRETLMSDPLTNSNSGRSTESTGQPRGSRMSVPEIARRLNIGRLAVYTMLEQGIVPGIRLGRRWIITRHAYEQWERTCGTGSVAGLSGPPEVTVLN